MRSIWSVLLLLIVLISVCDASKSFFSRRNRCNPCPPGWGVVQPCSHRDQASRCEMCQEGAWAPSYPHHKPCKSCSECGPDEYIIRQCSTLQDAVCASCLNAKAGSLTEDYYVKCRDETDLSEEMDDSEVEVRDAFTFSPSDILLKDNSAAKYDDPAFVSFDDPEFSMESRKDEKDAVDIKPCLPEPTKGTQTSRLISKIFKRKIYVIFGLLCLVMLALSMVVLVWMIRYRRSYQRAWLQHLRLGAYQRLQEGLTEEQKSIIEECAERLPSVHGKKGQQLPKSSASEFVVQVNPLEQLLDRTD